MKAGGTARWWVGGLAALSAVAVRLITFTPHFSLRKLLAYDDSAYFASAQMLVEGHLPYQAFPFVQPPGSMLIGAPFAMIGSFLGGDVGMAVLRVAMIGLAALTCWLIADLLRPYGLAATAAGALLFAAHAVTVLEGRTFYLEPFLTFAVVWTFWLLRRDPRGIRRYVLVGLILGFACTVKVWAGMDVVVFAAYLGATRGPRKLLAWLGGVIGAIVVVCLPFFLVAPGAMWDQVVSAQLDRTAGHSWLERLGVLGGFNGFPFMSIRLTTIQSRSLVVIGLLAALAPLIVAIIRRRSPRCWGPPAWWSLVATVEVVTLLLAPTSYSHYWVWPAGALALGIGRTVGYLDRDWSRLPLLGCVALMAVALAVVPYRATRVFTVAGPPPTSELRAFTADQNCTFYSEVTVLGSVAGRGIAMYAPCRRWPDPVGAALVGSPSGRDPLFSRYTDASWQSELREQLRAADSAVLCGSLASRPFAAATERLFTERFIRVGSRSANGVACSLWKVGTTVND